MPIVSITATIAILTGLKVIKDRPAAVPFRIITKAHACLFDTMPDGIGLFLPLALSRSESIRSFKIYIPVDISSVIIGRTSVWMAENTAVWWLMASSTPGRQSMPVTVASEYIIPHFLRDWKRIS